MGLNKKLQGETTMKKILAAIALVGVGILLIPLAKEMERRYKTYLKIFEEDQYLW